ncbi:MAG TPA: hypothetical protein PK693_08280 [Halothiobacillus sp.]|nr:hypothetical protein [Halothiobacillus sp.]
MSLKNTKFLFLILLGVFFSAAPAFAASSTSTGGLMTEGCAFSTYL